jgi:hypothetical protein
MLFLIGIGVALGADFRTNGRLVGLGRRFGFVTGKLENGEISKRLEFNGILFEVVGTTGGIVLLDQRFVLGTFVGRGSGTEV